jgi:hypothetical protein
MSDDIFADAQTRRATLFRLFDTLPELAPPGISGIGRAS